MLARFPGSLIVVAVLTAVPVHASTLKGRVEDNTGGRISGATIVVACPGDARSTESDAGGRFEVRDLPAAKCGVSASHANFASSFVEIVLPADGVAEARIVLPVHAIEEGVVVTPARGGRETAGDVPAGVSIVTGRDLAMRPYQVLPQALREEPGISIQQTTAAAGSPIVRGYTGPGNVYLVDGVRLNTSAWRGGPSQYMAWLSPATVERVEIVRGPMSVQYGSDALGGVVNVLQARPPFSSSGRRGSDVVGALAGSADASRGLDGAVTYQTPSAAIAFSGTIKRVDDLRTGGGVDSRAAVTRFLGIGSTAVADRLQGTGYRQWGAQVSAQARAGREGIVSGFFRHDEQRGVNRYDRIGGGEGLYRSEIAPQRLDFGVLRFERASLGALDGVRASFSVNRQQDGSVEQARPNARIDSERTTLTSLGYQAQASKSVKRQTAIFGGEIYDETIAAGRWQQTAGAPSSIRPLIPDGTRYTSTGLFASVVSSELSGRVSLRGGVRYNGYRYRSNDNAAFSIHGERVDTHAVTFNSAATIAIARSLRATFSASRGFRAANMSDLGAIGVSGGGGFEISPSTASDLHAVIGTTDGADSRSTGRAAGGLGPESEMAYEAGLRFSARAVSLALTGFDLELYDAVQRRALIFDTPVVGLVISGQEIVSQDSAGLAYIAIDPRPVGTRVNSGRGRVRGLDAEGRVAIGHHWNARAWFSMANGRDLETGAWFRRMAPPMGGVMAGWQRGADRLRVEATMTFARPQTRLASGDLSDARIGGRRTAGTIAAFFNGTAVDMGLVRAGLLLATDETLAQVQARVLNGASASYLFTAEPGWVAFGARALWPLGRSVDLIVIGENLTDRNYRLIGSGVDAPGANVQFRTRIKF